MLLNAPGESSRSYGIYALPSGRVKTHGFGKRSIISSQFRVEYVSMPSFLKLLVTRRVPY